MKYIQYSLSEIKQINKGVEETGDQEIPKSDHLLYLR